MNLPPYKQLPDDLGRVLETERTRFKQQAAEIAESHGAVFFDGVLVSESQAAAAFKERSKRQIGILAELTLLLVAFGALIYPFFDIVRSLCR